MRNQSGMTLVEVLIATAALTLVMYASGHVSLSLAHEQKKVEQTENFQSETFLVRKTLNTPALCTKILGGSKIRFSPDPNAPETLALQTEASEPGKNDGSQILVEGQDIGSGMKISKAQLKNRGQIDATHYLAEVSFEASRFNGSSLVSTSLLVPIEVTAAADGTLTVLNCSGNDPTDATELTDNADACPADTPVMQGFNTDGSLKCAATAIPVCGDNQAVTSRDGKTLTCTEVAGGKQISGSFVVDTVEYGRPAMYWASCTKATAPATWKRVHNNMVFQADCSCPEGFKATKLFGGAGKKFSGAHLRTQNGYTTGSYVCEK